MNKPAIIKAIICSIIMIMSICSCDTDNSVLQEDATCIETPAPSGHTDIVLYPFRENESMKWGYMDKEGTVIITPQYDIAENFIKNLAVVCIRDDGDDTYSGNWGIIDKNNNIIIPLIYDNITMSEESILALTKEPPRRSHGGEIWRYKNEQGKTIFELVDYAHAAPFCEGLARVQEYANFGLIGCIDNTGEYVIPPQYINMSSFSEGLALVSSVAGINSKYGFIDTENNSIIPEIYESADVFSEEVAPVQVDGKWGYINRNNELVIPFKYENASIFSEGVASVEENGLWGIINHDGEYILSPQYPFLSDCYNGLIMVGRRDEYIDSPYYINLRGEIIRPNL